MNDDGTMARVPQLRKIADKLNVKMITIKDLVDYRNKKDNLVKREV
jgi:3,4-dihydroxy 2-butanone 4-phosphate synthase/GTP cyclohydrolase II